MIKIFKFQNKVDKPKITILRLACWTCNSFVLEEIPQDGTSTPKHVGVWYLS
jgi:hypothetical protein